MPPLPPAANVIKIAIVGHIQNDLDVVTRFFMHYTGSAPTPAQLNTLATAISVAWTNRLQGLHTLDKNIDSITIEDLTSSTGAVGVWTGQISGTLAENPLPAGTALLLNYSVARRYRGGKPRQYLYVGSQARLSNPQFWVGAFLTTTLTDWGLFIGDIKAAPWAGATIDQQVNVSFYSGYTNFTGPTGRIRARSTPRVGAAVVDNIIATSANTRFASQRRRNRP